MTTTNPPKSLLHTNETYEILTDADAVRIDAHDPFGLARALATLSQLVESVHGTNNYTINIKTTIRDQPVYRYRAVMVDSARHFLPVSTLKR